MAVVVVVGGIPQRQARTVAATGATDKRVESQGQALRQRDCPSPKGRLEYGRRRESQRLSTSKARARAIPSPPPFGAGGGRRLRAAAGEQ